MNRGVSNLTCDSDSALVTSTNVLRLSYENAHIPGLSELMKRQKTNAKFIVVGRVAKSMDCSHLVTQLDQKPDVRYEIFPQYKHDLPIRRYILGVVVYLLEFPVLAHGRYGYHRVCFLDDLIGVNEDTYNKLLVVIEELLNISLIKEPPRL